MDSPIPHPAPTMLRKANSSDLRLIYSVLSSLGPGELYMLSGQLYAYPLTMQQLRRDCRALLSRSEGIYCLFQNTGKESAVTPNSPFRDSAGGIPRARDRIRAFLASSLPRLFRWPAGEGDLLGFFHIRKREGQAAMLAVVYIRPEFRRMGYAKEMLRAGFQEARGQGLNRLLLNVFSSNPAIHLYESLGFQRSGSKAVFLPDGRPDTKVFMQRKLG